MEMSLSALQNLGDLPIVADGNLTVQREHCVVDEAAVDVAMLIARAYVLREGRAFRARAQF